MRTIAQQIAAMRAQQPGFGLVAADERFAVWEGELRPFARPYKVRIAYQTPLLVEMFTIGGVQPRVKVLSPILEQHDDYELGPLPHVYWDKDDPERPFLCLFSPDGNEWGLDDLIADTTVFWSARWLCFYEGWLATRKWKGGGRHLGDVKEGKQLAAV